MRPGAAGIQVCSCSRSVLQTTLQLPFEIIQA